MAKIIPYEDYIKIVEEEIRKSYKDAFPNAEAVLSYMKTKDGQDIVKGEYHNWKESTADVPASYWASRASWNLWMLA